VVAPDLKAGWRVQVVQEVAPWTTTATSPPQVRNSLTSAFKGGFFFFVHQYLASITSVNSVLKNSTL
jgi:hypothetical protein